MTQNAPMEHVNRRSMRRLLLVAVAMFGFGYLMAPMYDLICQVTGLGGKTGRVDTATVAAKKVDAARTITVEFTGNANAGLPWEFRPMVKKIEVHPGETATVKYYARNMTNEEISGQAIPSVTPGISATHFKKIECFCFTRQTLKPGEAREMPVQFVVDAGVDKDVHTITLSYAFFNADKSSAKKYGGDALTPETDHASHGTHAGTASGS